MCASGVCARIEINLPIYSEFGYYCYWHKSLLDWEHWDLILKEHFLLAPARRIMFEKQNKGDGNPKGMVREKAAPNRFKVSLTRQSWPPVGVWLISMAKWTKRLVLTFFLSFAFLSPLFLFYGSLESRLIHCTDFFYPYTFPLSLLSSSLLTGHHCYWAHAKLTECSLWTHPLWIQVVNMSLTSKQTRKKQTSTQYSF